MAAEPETVASDAAMTEVGAAEAGAAEAQTEAIRAPFRPFSTVVGLALCAAVYFAFHAARDDLSGHWLLELLQGAFPSFLLGFSMVLSVGLLPSVRFSSQSQRVLRLLGAIFLAAIWFEAIVPLFAAHSVGSWLDGLAMVLGATLPICLSRTAVAVKSKKT